MSTSRESTTASGFSTDPSTADPESLASIIKGARITIPVISFESFIPLDSDDRMLTETTAPNQASDRRVACEPRVRDQTSLW